MRQSNGRDGRPADLPPVRWLRWFTASGLAFAGAIAWVTSHSQVSDTVSGDLGGTVLRVLVVVVVPVALVLASLYAFWRFRLEQLAYAPGPILVAPFVDDLAGAPGETARARRLRAMFEQRLAGSRVYRSTAVPTPALSNGFLHIVEHAGESLPAGWGFVTRILRALAPEYAYVVRCSLIEGRTDVPGGDRRRNKGLLVEVSRLPRSSVAPVIVWEEEWSRVIERAANRVAELILPRTPQCRTPPWTPWRGLRIPEELFDTYHRFQTLKDARRFDEAMAVLRGALRMDPSNLALRLELGKLQEQMRMHLDALLTYDDLIGLASRKNAELSAWWNRPALALREGPDEPWSDPVRARTLKAHHPVVEIARYRHALLLGLGYELADEWWRRPEWCAERVHLSAREERRRYLRRVLSERFTARYPAELTPYLSRHIGPDGMTECLAPEVTRDIGSAERVRRAAQARMVFTMASVIEVQRLINEARVPWRAARREVLSARALRLMRPWAVLRHVMAVSAVEGLSTDAHPVTLRQSVPAARFARAQKYNLGQWWWRIGSDSRYLVEREWPPRMDDDEDGFVERGVRPAVRRIMGRPSFGSLRSWHEHYNAACVYALMLSPDVPADPDDFFPRVRDEGVSRTAGGAAQKLAHSEDHRRATRAAITELKKAVAAVGSGRLANQRDWILTNDPDFDQLRGQDEFRDFEVLTFGSVSRAARRGPRLARWEQISSVGRGVLDAARRMTALWEARLVEELDVGAEGVVLGWIENEETAWAFLEGIAVDHRDWSRRNKFREDVRAYSGWTDFQVEPAQVVYSDTELAIQYAAMSGRTQDDIAKRRRDREVIAETVDYAIRQHNRRWAALAATLRVNPCEGCCPRHHEMVLAREHANLRALVEERGLGEQVRLLFGEWSRQNHRRWEALASWFDDETAGRDLVTTRAAEFHRSLRAFRVDPAGRGGRLFSALAPLDPPDDDRWQDDPQDT